MGLDSGGNIAPNGLVIVLFNGILVSIFLASGFDIGWWLPDYQEFYWKEIITTILSLRRMG